MPEAPLTVGDISLKLRTVAKVIEATGLRIGETPLLEKLSPESLSKEERHALKLAAETCLLTIEIFDNIKE